MITAIVALTLMCACGNGSDRAVAKDEFDPDSTALSTTMALSKAHFEAGRFDSALFTAQAALDSARLMNLPRQQVAALISLGRLAQEHAQYDSAVHCYEGALGLAQRYNQAADEARSLLNRGLVREKQGRYEEALADDLRAMHIYDSIGDRKRLAYMKNNISHLYVRLGDPPKAFASLKESIAIKHEVGDHRGAANSIGLWGYLLLEQGKIDSAIFLLGDAVAQYDSLGFGNAGGEHILNLGLAYDERGDDDTAMIHYARAMELATERDDPEMRLVLLNNIGTILLDRGDFDGAHARFAESLAMADSIGSVEDQRIGHGSFALLYERTGEYAKALVEHKLGEALADTLMNQQRMATMNELLVRYETERKDRENDRLKAEGQEALLKSQRAWGWAVAMAAVAGAIALLAFVIVRTRRNRARERVVELEQQALRSQMDPHFLFNALNTIPGLYASQDNLTASKYVGHLSGLLRSILSSSRQPVVPLRQELELVQHYLHVSASRHPECFTWTINVDPAVDADRIDLPSMILQPLVENAIVHGLIPRGEGGVLRIDLSRAGKLLVCRIEDNGVGRNVKPHGVVEQQQASQGLRITAERIQRFNRAEPAVEGLDVTDLKDGRGAPAGTLVIVRTLINNAPRP